MDEHEKSYRVNEVSRAYAQEATAHRRFTEVVPKVSAGRIGSREVLNVDMARARRFDLTATQERVAEANRSLQELD